MESGTQPRMERRLGLLPATALNMANMLGAGPFITRSTLMSALGGPQSMLGWLVALLVAVCDGMVWAELGAAAAAMALPSPLLITLGQRRCHRAAHHTV